MGMRSTVLEEIQICLKGEMVHVYVAGSLTSVSARDTSKPLGILLFSECSNNWMD